MSIKILIVEDEDLYADKLEMLVDKLGYEHLATVDNSEDAIALIKKEIPDLILMDVHIQGKHDGIELADLIHKEYSIPIIFITSLKDELTFSRASRVDPISFLLKPFNDVQLQRTIELCVQKLAKKEQELPENEKTSVEWESDFIFKGHFYIKTRQRLDKVSIEDVIFIESDGHYCQVHTSIKKFLVRVSLAEMNQRLPEKTFFQVHRSYIVNMNKVESVELKESIIILGKNHIPLSRRNREILLEKLTWI